MEDNTGLIPPIPTEPLEPGATHQGTIVPESGTTGNPNELPNAQNGTTTFQIPMNTYISMMAQHSVQQQFTELDRKMAVERTEMSRQWETKMDEKLAALLTAIQGSDKIVPPPPPAEPAKTPASSTTESGSSDNTRKR